MKAVASMHHFAHLIGFPIIESSLSVSRRQWRAPRTKKRRIRKKWAKVDSNWRESPAAFRIGNNIVAHPAIVARLKKLTPARL